MKRKIPGLHNPAANGEQQPNTYLVRVVAARYRANRLPYLDLTFSLLEPAEHRGLKIVSRMDCRPKSFWKLTWFLKDFGYDAALLYDDEIDEKTIVGLEGVITISNRARGQQRPCTLHSFAPAHSWRGPGEPIKTIGNQELAS